MKLKYFLSLLLIAAGGASQLWAQTNNATLVVHEWGTFTSFQGGDGVLLNWRPLQSPALPNFVYDWARPGMERRYVGDYTNKNLLVTLQRMETPVVYFYSDHLLDVDLTVRFPQGRITEWYPQADQAGPSRPVTTNAMAPRYGLSSESLLHWANLMILPRSQFANSYQKLPEDANGSHYFAARETDSDYVVSSPGPDRFHGIDAAIFSCGGAQIVIPPAVNQVQASVRDTSMITHPIEPLPKLQPEVEKFLFYRGAGSFTTPLRVTMTADDSVTLENTGSEPLAHLFVLNVRQHAGNYVYVAELKHGERKTVALTTTEPPMACDALTPALRKSMLDALQKFGLYPREADAMVNTWKDSWFQENGVRVLYILPRSWTDETLPMTLTPTPKSLVRVMVGRAEVFSPGAEKILAGQLGQARSGDAQASAEARTTLKELGRFAEPAFNQALASINAPSTEKAKLVAILNEARKAE